MHKTIRVDLGPRSYEVRVGPGLLDQIGSFVPELGNVSRAVVIADDRVAGLFAPKVVEPLAAAGIRADLLTFPAGETSKNLTTYSVLMDGVFALRPRIDRKSLVVALGGGVAGDLAGFVAATALRGLRWIQCPTTVLSDVDASVGGKTGVDHPAGKNLIGAFHQPSGVLIDIALLKTLGDREFRSGLAECVKHGVIRDAALLDVIEDHAAEILARDEGLLTDFIARNVAIKAEVVAADERETGGREVLNFGHSIGHAIESAVGYDQIAHGEAVSLGMVAACRMAVSRGLIEAEAEQRVEDLLTSLKLPVRQSGLDSEQVWQIMQHDKKNRAGRVRMILPVMLGQVAVFDDITESCVRNALAALAD